MSDEIRTQRFASPLERALDLGACAAGLLVAGIGAALNLREGAAAAPVVGLLRVFGGLALACAPAVLFGAVAWALLASRSRFFRWDAFLLILVLLGARAAMAWAAITVILALPVARHFRAEGRMRSWTGELVGSVRQRAPPMLALLMVAAGLEIGCRSFPTSLPAAAMLLLALVLSARLDEAGAVAIAAVLVGKGLDPGLAVAGLAFGPLTRAALARAVSARGRMRGAVALAIECAAAAVAARLLSATGVLAGAPAVAEQALQPARAAFGEQLAASPLGAASALVLVALALATLWSAGVRGWFAPLRHGPSAI